MGVPLLYGFLVIFAVVGGLELFDRTSFSLLALASRYSPLAIWVGGALAFVASTAIAVSIGAALVAAAGTAGLSYLRVGGGSFLIAYAIWLGMRGPEGEEGARPLRAAHSAAVLAFATTFLLEMGDTTMIFQIVFVATYGWLLVLVAGASALIVVAAFDAFVGGRFASRLEARTLNRIVVAILVVVGAVTILYGLFPGLFGWVG